MVNRSDQFLWRHVLRVLPTFMITVVTAINLWLTVVNLKAFRDVFDIVSTSRIELPELPPDSYPPIVASCIERFDNPYAEGPGPLDHPPLQVAYVGDLSFQIKWRGRSRNLSLKNDRSVEDVSLRMRIVRNFRTPTLVEAEVVIADAKQTPWPADSPMPADVAFQPFDADQREKLSLYVNFISSYLTNCVRDETTQRDRRRALGIPPITYAPPPTVQAR
ncbi:hypothetical protein FBZ96_102966 [Bradyrhizobium stylosanthis]|uniref:Uncharacterized protein n=1 Tax=Bradyrhizobium stylosanthis TaxID=1803665 RepID=A0A560E5C6_9BRAD|nr:hypothetical protein FBZ96_102966 [Bradyrhizobium stylosanthis]